jgi:hypothetical protein
MKAKWLGVALGCAVVAAGCGKGRAIFNVDAYSFIKGTGSDTRSYTVPPGVSGSAGTTPQKISLPGAGSSIVDSVRAFGTLDLNNTNGSGTIGLDVYLAADSISTLNASAKAITVPIKSVSGSITTADTIRADLTAAFNSLFAQSQLWIRFVVNGSADPGLNPLQGTAVVTSLQLTVIISDKFF